MRFQTKSEGFEDFVDDRDYFKNLKQLKIPCEWCGKVATVYHDYQCLCDNCFRYYQSEAKKFKAPKGGFKFKDINKQ